MTSSFSIFDPCKESIANLILETNDLAIDKDLLIASISRPPNPGMGDLALPGFRFAKELKQNPKLWAATVIEKCSEFLQQNPNAWIESCQVEGAFLNFKLRLPALAQYLFPAILSKDFFKLKKYKSSHHYQKTMIEYSQPNTHKNFHIGHVRNVCLGDSLYRLFNYCDFDIIPVNYIGDEGTHIAECLWYIQKNSLMPPEHNNERVIWLEKAYSSAKLQIAEASPEDKKTWLEEVGDIHHQLEQKKGSSYDFWLESKGWCMQAFHEIYEWLDVRFEHYFYESDLTEESQKIVDKYLTKGIFVEDQGAIGIDLKDEGAGFAIYRKSNGATLYATKDLVLAAKKFKEFNIGRSIYVVGAEQTLHFKQVFKTLERMGFEQAKNCYHLSYALVKLPDGKMSTRKGTAIHFQLVREKILEKLNDVLDKYSDEWSKDEIQSTSRKLAIAAIKYGMLNMDPHKEITFQIDDWLGFEGNTGPYLLYTLTRAKSILRKSTINSLIDLQTVDPKRYDELHCRPLLQSFYDFNEVVAQSCENYRPSTLCTYLYNMCKEFNRFYATTPILKAKDPKFVGLAISLVQCFENTLEQGLNLIGIKSIERM